MKIPYNVLKAASLFMADRDIRYYLNGLLIDRTKDHTFIVGTNGHMMGIFRGDAKRQTEGQTIASATTVNDALRTFKPKASRRHTCGDDPLELSILGNLVTFSRAMQAVTGPEIDGVYPDWRRVVPRMTVMGPPGQFNPEYMKVFGDAGRCFGTGRESDGCIAVCHNGANSGAQVLLTAALPLGWSFLGVLMPARVDSSPIDVDAWIGKSPAQSNIGKAA